MDKGKRDNNSTAFSMFDKASQHNIMQLDEKLKIMAETVKKKQEELKQKEDESSLKNQMDGLLEEIERAREGIKKLVSFVFAGSLSPEAFKAQNDQQLQELQRIIAEKLFELDNIQKNDV